MCVDFEVYLVVCVVGSDQVVGLLGLEGGYLFEGDIVKMDQFWDEGYCLIGLYYFFDNELGGLLYGYYGVGLLDFGKVVVVKVVVDGWIIDFVYFS